MVSCRCLELSQLVQPIGALCRQNVLHLKKTAPNNSVTTDIEYLHNDHLGSIAKITNASGSLIVTLPFETFGARKDSDWLRNTDSTELNTLLAGLKVHTNRGYTGHEHLDRTGFIHMNGRLYEPTIGRFMSPDPIVSAPGYGQSWNRGSYVFNSPLMFTDPSGYRPEIEQYGGRCVAEVSDYEFKWSQPYGCSGDTPIAVNSYAESELIEEVVATAPRLNTRPLVGLSPQTRWSQPAGTSLVDPRNFWSGGASDGRIPARQTQSNADGPTCEEADEICFERCEHLLGQRLNQGFDYRMCYKTCMASFGCNTGNSPISEDSMFSLEYWQAITGLTGAALIAYLILSEGSRLFPPRNLIPIP